MRAIGATVSGRVQGVGFRYSALREALRWGITGWASNRPDGSVAVRAQGEASDLEGFVAWLHEGPRSARVDSVTVLDTPVDGSLAGFEIR